MTGQHTDTFELPQLDWTYEMRRECQEVVSGIWVGPAESGKNLENLLRLDISSIVVLRSPCEALFLKPRFPDQFQYLVLDVHDRQDQNLISIYPSFRDFVDASRVQGQRVLIHDDGGMSRAPAMAAMYVIDKRALKFQDAISMIQYRRYCIHINQGFVRQLKEFEAVCLARDQYKKHQQTGESAKEMNTIKAARRRREENGDSSFEASDNWRQQKRGREEMEDEERDAMET
ncbi:phosphatases II [Tilletiaria anomala UBC 951]|uniref:Phosphatases II n=1 Tax=Tilletiaria anomala (strain ATCC 24038 / CBS 436.72 / UBC 951) TaxID=1037660 RepID=A0A066VIX3_TILAU|nr:phosphatases II [Tilletiaria anomala UBC 951]KDN40248.1 phosphatases II [Tilletiaria anomala UBC 951]